MTGPEVAALERWASDYLVDEPDNVLVEVLALCAAWRAQQAEIARLREILRDVHGDPT